jgi:hypothetical protein
MMVPTPTTLPLAMTNAASTKPTSEDETRLTRDIYLYGTTPYGLQVARTTVDNLNDSSAYTYYHPSVQKFVATPPRLYEQKSSHLYLSGTFTSGTVFFSPYFKTFVMSYLNGMHDGVFYARYLDLNAPIRNQGTQNETWVRGGRNGDGVHHEDVEALTMYRWSEEMVLHIPSTLSGRPAQGQVHSEWFNRQYYAESMFPQVSRTICTQSQLCQYQPQAADVYHRAK